MNLFWNFVVMTIMVIGPALIILVIIEIKKYQFEKMKYSMSDKWDEHSIDCFYDKIDEYIEYSSEELSEKDFEKINNDKNLKKAINAVLNYFEGVGYVYNRNIINKKFAESCFSDPLITAYKRYYPIIEESRIKYNEPRMLCELEKMYNVMITKRNKINKK